MTPSFPRAGIYVHLPFCLRKCPYCDFYSDICAPEQRIAFLDALKGELDLRAAPELKADSLYFGGGTPSLFAPEQIAGIIHRVRDRFNLTADAEITLEANPGTVDRKKLEGYRRAGVNRLNLGVQSFNDANLAFLGRIHNAAEARHAIDDARAAGFQDFGLDLIYGLPGQTAKAWRADLDAALDAGPTHLSCYMLTYASGTPLDEDRAGGRFQPLPEADLAVLFEQTAEVLTAGGFIHYEISNFARAGDPPFWSRHNRKYWNLDSYLGFGPAAHSFDGRRRYWNDADLDAYRDALQQHRLPPGSDEVLTREQQMTEALFLGLRQIEGLAFDVFEGRFGVDCDGLFGRAIADLVAAGLADVEGRCCRLTRRGLLVADAAAACLGICF